jgi:hypothetical protein
MLAGFQQHRSATGAVPCGDIGKPISNHEASSQIQVIFCCRASQESGPRFPALAFYPVAEEVSVWVVGAGVDSIEFWGSMGG